MHSKRVIRFIISDAAMYSKVYRHEPIKYAGNASA